MAGSPIKIRVVGTNAETDAPTVEDLLEQVGDYFCLMREVERALAEDGTNALDWRITNASKHSPLEIELTPFPRYHGVDISNRERLVVESTNKGLAMLVNRAERPTYFTDSAMTKAEHLFRRVTNGLGRTAIDAGGLAPNVEIVPVVARKAASNVESVRKPHDKPYRELGSLEGYLQSVERDGYGRSRTACPASVDWRGRQVRGEGSGNSRGRHSRDRRNME